MSRLVGLFAFACLVGLTAETASAQGYRYGIQSNGYGKGYSALQLQQRQSYSPNGQIYGNGNRYGSYRVPYNGGVNIYVQPNYGYGYGYGYGYPYGRYPYYGGTTYGSQLNVYPGGLYQYYQGQFPYYGR